MVEVRVHQYDTYHPFLPLIPRNLRVALPLVQCCAVCGPKRPAQASKPLSKCSRCLAVSYCGRDHQLLHFKSHKKVCRHIQQCREKRDALAASLPAEMFAQHVGLFWRIPETRPFMHAKRDYMLALNVSMTYDGVSLAVQEGLDLMRLNRGDSLAIREALPPMMLLLGKLQDCYDFVKWWTLREADKTYDFGNMSLPYLDVKNADMLEEVHDDMHETNVYHVASLAYLKIKLGVDILIATERGDEAEMIANHVDPTVLAAFRTKPHSALVKMFDEVKRQSKELQFMVQYMNPFFWKHVQDVHSLSGQISNGSYKPGHPHSPGDVFEVQNWLIPHGLLWSQDTIMKSMLDSFDPFIPGPDDEYCCCGPRRLHRNH